MEISRKTERVQGNDRWAMNGIAWQKIWKMKHRGVHSIEADSALRSRLSKAGTLVAALQNSAGRHTLRYGRPEPSPHQVELKRDSKQ